MRTVGHILIGWLVVNVALLAYLILRAVARGALRSLDEHDDAIAAAFRPMEAPLPRPEYRQRLEDDIYDWAKAEADMNRRTP